MIPWEDNFVTLSKNQTEFIIGSLLGDARLECRSKQKTARLRIHHAESQKDYLFWKYRLLKNLVSTLPKRHSYIDKRYNKSVDSWYFHTKTLISLSKFYLLFYKDGRKIIPKRLASLVTPFVLAVWVMDDGCYFKKSLILNTQCFNYQEQQYLQIVINNCFGIKAGIQKDRKNYRLYFPIKETIKIKEILSGFSFVTKFVPVETDSV